MNRLKHSILITLSMITFFLVSEKVSAQCGSISFTVNDSTACIPQVLRFSVTGAPPAGTTYRWDFGSGFNPGFDTISQLYLTPGKYSVKLEINFPNNTKCIVTKTNYIEAGNKPIVNLTVDKSILCEGNDSVIISDLTPNSVSRDYIIEGIRYNSLEKVHTYKFSDTFGSKVLSAIVSGSLGCATIKNYNNIVYLPKPFEFDFTTDSTIGCVNRFANFEYQELVSGQTPISFNWDFSNATPDNSLDTNPQNIFYSTNDSSDVSLTVETQEGCAYTMSKEKWMTLEEPIDLQINVNQIDPCVGEYIKYEVSNSQSKIITWQFFPDTFMVHSQTDTSLTGEHRSVGAKVVSATQKYKGCISQTVIRNTVNVVGPESRFTANKTISCKSKDTVIFTNQSVEPAGENITYKCYIKDSSGSILDSATTENHTYIFNKFGSYTITLICYYDNNSCSDTLEKVDFINLRSIKVSSNVDPKVICIDQQVALNNATLEGSSTSPNIYSWRVFDEMEIK